MILFFCFQIFLNAALELYQIKANFYEDIKVFKYLVKFILLHQIFQIKSNQIISFGQMHQIFSNMNSIKAKNIKSNVHIWYL